MARDSETLQDEVLPIQANRCRTMMIRILFLIPSLVAHGAERQLCELVRRMDRTRFEIHVVVFYDSGTYEGGDLWPEFAALPGVHLHSLHKRRGALGYLTAVPRLLRLVLQSRAEVVHGYADGNLLALLAGRLLWRRVVWGIRRTSRDFSKLDSLSRRLLRLTVRLASRTDLVIFNSEAGRANHVALGMRAPRMAVVPNGFDVSRFEPDPAKGAAMRRAWGVPPEAPLIGIVGRLNPVKDHPGFLKAAALLRAEHPDARFICIGSGPAAYTDSLRALSSELGLDDRLLWPGACQDMPAAYNALSVLALCSTDEGFPNVVGEAMACGVPCVATRVGDAEALIGETGMVVEPGDPAAIKEALARLLQEPAEARAARGAASRARIVSLFDPGSLARKTEQALLSLVSSPESN